jgi:hypothetical protein
LESYWRKPSTLNLIYSLCIGRAERKTNITSWSRFLLEKLTVFQLVKKFPAFDTWRIIFVFKTDRYLYLSWTRSIQFRSSPCFLKIHFNTSLPSAPKFKVVYFFQISPPSKPNIELFFPRACYVLHLSLFDFIILKNI